MIHKKMKVLLILCSGLLFLALVNLPIGYYTFLRVTVTIVAIVVVVSENERGMGLWVILFGIIAVIFNPIFPVYLHYKNHWIPIDLLTAVLFIIKSLTIKKQLS